MIFLRDYINDGRYLTLEDFGRGIWKADPHRYGVVILLDREKAKEEAKEISALSARFARGENGESFLPSFALTSDENSLMDRWIDEGLRKVAELLRGYCRRVKDEIGYRVEYTPSPFGIEDDDDGTYARMTFLAGGRMDEVAWNSIDSNIQSALARFILQEWHLLNMRADMANVMSGLFGEYVAQAKRVWMDHDFPHRRLISPC